LWSGFAEEGGEGQGSYNASVPPSPAPDIVYAAVAGPSVRVKTPGKPQSLLSVPATHCKAYVVAAESCFSLGVALGMRGRTYRANNRTNKRLSISSWDVERYGGGLRITEACKGEAKDRASGRKHIGRIQLRLWLDKGFIE
jgi:hypothetical protein